MLFFKLLLSLPSRFVSLFAFFHFFLSKASEILCSYDALPLQLFSAPSFSFSGSSSGKFSDAYIKFFSLNLWNQKSALLIAVFKLQLFPINSLRRSKFNFTSFLLLSITLLESLSLRIPDSFGIILWPLLAVDHVRSTWRRCTVNYLWIFSIG